MELHASGIANLVGHAGGVALFTWFLVLAARRPVSQIAGSRLPLLIVWTTILWNAASIGVILTSPQPGVLSETLAGIAFSALSALPALLFQLCAGHRFPQLAKAGFLLAAIAAALHLAEIVTGGEAAHRIGLAIITVGFGALTAASAVILIWATDSRDAALVSRTVGTMSLFLFAISFAHFSEGHLDNAWSKEMFFHHAGIPLALIILLQDHRFVLLDALIRVLANIALALLFGWGTFRLLEPWQGATQWFGAALAFILFSALRRRFEDALFRLLFQPPNAQRIAAAQAQLRQQHTNETQYLESAGAELAALIGAPFLGVKDGQALELASPLYAPAYVPLRSAQPRPRLTALVIPIRMQSAESQYLLFGDRHGGRPYLSSDLDLLMQLAAVASEQLDQIRAWEARRLAASAELRALQSQINPHFLFNALNALYGAIPREAATARKTALNLADLFRYFVRTNRIFSTIGEELEIVNAYLSIEQQRLAGRLTYQVSCEPALASARIPILTVQPLVENAIKHGISANVAGGSVSVQVASAGERIHITVSHAAPGSPAAPPSQPGEGIALANIRRRLELCYGSEASLDLSLDREASTAELIFPRALNASPGAIQAA